MTKIILGLDLGTNSFGWAIRDLNEIDNQIIDKGVLTFEKGVLNVLPTYVAQVKDTLFKQILQRTINELHKGSHRKLPNNIDPFIKITNAKGK